MLDLILDEITLDDLATLRTELNDFFKAHDTYEWCFYESDPDTDQADRAAALKAELVRDRVRSLAINWGLHKEFLKQYDDLRSTLAKQALEPQPDLAAF